jgi:tryptophanyl-tRNA synthetase
MSEPVKNLFTLMKIMSSEDTYSYFLEAYNNCTIRYGEMKKQLAEDIIKFTEPIRLRINELKNNETYLKKVIVEGANKARESASKTLKEVREIIGFKEF